jgi:transcriptional regulator with XRE-family HTH domain
MPMPPAPVWVAQLLREARANARLTTREVQEQCGVSPGTLSRLETGQLNNPTLRVMRALTALYKLPPEVWFS